MAHSSTERGIRGRQVEYKKDRRLGIYVSKKEAYDRAVAWWNDEQKLPGGV